MAASGVNSTNPSPSFQPNRREGVGDLRNACKLGDQEKDSENSRIDDAIVRDEMGWKERKRWIIDSFIQRRRSLLSAGCRARVGLPGS